MDWPAVLACVRSLLVDDLVTELIGLATATLLHKLFGPGYLPFPGSEQLVRESMERLQPRHWERYNTHTDHNPLKTDLFGRPIE